MPARAVLPIIAVVVVTLLGAQGYPTGGATEKALAADDACDADAGGGCAVSALQQRLLADRVETDEALEELVRYAHGDSAALDKKDPAWEMQIAVTKRIAQAQKMAGHEMVWIAPDKPNTPVTSLHRVLAKACKRTLKGNRMQLFNATCLCTASIPPQVNIQEGTYDLLFQALRKYEHDDSQQYLQQYLWRALSDQTLTERGSGAIADSGGHNNGVLYMAQQLATKPPYYAYCSDKLTLAYEIMMCMHGLLLFDADGTRTQTVVQAGVIPKLVHVMKTEPDIIAMQSTGCLAMAWIMRRHPDSVALFKAAGALPLIDSALERFKDGDSSPFFFGKTLGDTYPIKNCLPAKFHLEGDRAKYEDAWGDVINGLLTFKPFLKLHWPPPAGF